MLAKRRMSLSLMPVFLARSARMAGVLQAVRSWSVFIMPASLSLTAIWGPMPSTLIT